MSNDALGQQRSLRRGLFGCGLGIGLLLCVAAIVTLQYGRGAFDELTAQLALLRQADDTTLTLYEWAGDDARAISAGLRGLALPEGAGDIRLARQGDVRPHYWLRLSLGRATLAALIESTCLPQPSTDNSLEFDYGRSPEIVAQLPWWQPERLTRPVMASCEADGITLRLAAGGGEPATVYLEIAPAAR